jgi:hypothetical protein
MLQRAVGAVVAGGESVMIPEGFAGDSVTFSLSLINPQVSQSGKLIPASSRQSTPVFTIATAWTKPVTQTREPNIIYPEISRSLMTIGNVRLVFPVDRSGRAIVDSVTEIWPSGVEKPTGDLRDAYEAFVRAVKHGLPQARYSPGVIGGCTVKQMVSQIFEFKYP